MGNRPLTNTLRDRQQYHPIYETVESSAGCTAAYDLLSLLTEFCGADIAEGWKGIIHD